MTEEEKRKRIERANRAFNQCVDGATQESGKLTFGVNSPDDLIGKKFFFLRESRDILNWIPGGFKNGDTKKTEALLGRVEWIKFIFDASGIELPEGQTMSQYVSKVESITDIKGETCFLSIHTSIGALFPPEGEDNPWILEHQRREFWQGDVEFI